MHEKVRKITSFALVVALLFNLIFIATPQLAQASDTNIAPQARVTVSSFYGNDPTYAGAHAADGRMDSEWASATSSPWIELDWDNTYEVSRIVIYDRPDGADAIGGVLSFSNGAHVTVSDIPGNGDAKEIVLDSPIVTDLLKFEITGNGWNGVGLVELQVFGVESASGTPVQSISVVGSEDTISIPGGALQLNVVVLPEDATMKSVTWVVYESDGYTPTDKAVIDHTGLLTAQSDGEVKVVAIAKDGSSVSGYKDIAINQSIPVGSNIARGAKVTTSTEHSAEYKGTFAVDGQLNTEWASNETTPWIQLDWNEPQTITKIVLFDRADGNHAAGKLLFSNGKEIKVDGVPNDGVTPKTIILPNPIVASSIKFDIREGSGGWNVGLREFEVHGYPSGTSKPVESITVSGVGGTNTVIIKKGTLQMIASVLPADATNQSVAWTVLEEDGVTPTKKAKINDQGKLSAAADGTVTVVASAMDGSMIAGSVKVTLSGQGVDPSMGTNIAGNAAVSASTEYSSAYVGSNATDGDISTEWASKETKPWINLEWEQAKTIHKIIVYDRNDPANADGGNITFSNGTKLEVKDIPGDGSPKEIDLDTPIVAKWLRFDISSTTGFNSIGLAEMEVFGFDEGAVTPVVSIAVSGETSNAIVVKGGSLKMVAAATPSDATDQRVKWFVHEPDGSATIKATIDQTGTLTATKKKDGDVRVRAVAIDGTGVIGEAIISLVNQEVNANTPPDATATIDFANNTVKGSSYIFGFNKNPMRMHADVMFPKLADIGMTRIRNTVYLDYILKDVCGSLEDWNSNTNGCQNPDNWNWDQFWWVDEAKANNMKVAMIFAYAPSFLTYSGDYFGVPKDWEVYEDIVQKVYLRYQDQIDWVEILNEPDASWFINLEGSGYSRIAFVKDSYYHIANAIREVDSDVIMGGLGTFEPVTEEILAVMDDPRITPDMLQYGSFHKYSPESGKTDIQIFKDVFESRASKGFNADSPIMITEYNTSPGNYEERGFNSASWLGLQLSRLIKQGYYAADFYAAFPSYQPIYGETDFSEGSVSNYGMYKWNETSGTGEFLPLGYTFKLLSKSLGLGKGEFQVKAATAVGLDDAFGAVNSDGQQVGFVVNESDEVKNIEVVFDNVDQGNAEVNATAYMVSGWSDGSTPVPVFTRADGNKVKVSLSLPSHAIAGIILNLEPLSILFPGQSLGTANGDITANPWDYMKLTANTIQGEIIWKSSIPYIGNIDAAGRFFALAEGTTTVTAQSAVDSNIKVEVQIHVSAMSVPLLQIELNQHRIFTMSRSAIQLETTTLKPLEAVNKSLIWKSANPDIASVSQDGLVTIHKEGKAIIRVESSVNPGVYDECMIVITPEGNMLAGLYDKVTVSGEQPSDLGRFAIDGNMGSRWSDSNKDAYWLQVDLGEEKAIGRYLIVNAGPFESWLGDKINTHALQLQTSNDGENWVTVDDVKGNREDILDRELPAGTKARFVRFYITEPQDPTTMYQAVRIYEIIMLPPQASKPGGTDSSGGPGNGGGSTGSPNAPSVGATDNGIEIKVKLDSNNGVVAASISEEVIKEALALLADHSGVTPMITISVLEAGDVKEVSIQLPASALKLLTQLNGVGLKVDAGMASMSFDVKALESIYAEGSDKEVVFTVKAVDTTRLPKEAQQIIAGRPAVDLTVQSGDTLITSFGGIVEIVIPYMLQSGELQNAIVPYFIDDISQLKPMRGRYASKPNRVAFKTSHFSQYAVGYHPVSFTDVADTAWYKDAIDFIAARDIVMGTGNGHFSPIGRVTRGQMIVMLMRAYEIEPDQHPTDNFSDAGQTYYTGYLAAAKRLKLAEGIGNNNYMPEQEITRQDMATILYRVLKHLGQLPVSLSEHTFAGFLDGEQVAKYAKEAMSYFTASGILMGSSSMLNPHETTTRAQMAQVLYQLLLK
jgi:nitrogen fixation protein